MYICIVGLEAYSEGPISAILTIPSCREVLVCHHPSKPRELWSVKEARVKVGAGGRLPVTLVVRAVGIVVLEEGDLLAQIALA